MLIIAEIGQNHNGDMELAKQLINAAKDCGADVAKFQAYEAVALFPKEGNEWYDYNCKTELSFDQILYLKEECDRVGIEFMASAFDPERVEWLEKAEVKRHKLASRSINDKQLLNALTATKKQLLVSLGFWEKDEFPEVESNSDVDFLYCISKYPTPLSDLNLKDVDFNQYAGFSDHTIGVSAPLVALARGAKILEKHFTLDKTMYGPDHACSMTPSELSLISEFRIDLQECL